MSNRRKKLKKILNPVNVESRTTYKRADAGGSTSDSYRRNTTVTDVKTGTTSRRKVREVDGNISDEFSKHNPKTGDFVYESEKNGKWKYYKVSTTLKPIVVKGKRKKK